MRKTIILLVIAISFCITGQGKIGDMKFRHLDTRHGLSNSQVNCILQDSRGFIWICTSFGLCRYDGYRFQNYFSYERDTTTLRSNRMDDIQEAYDGKLWLNHGMSYSLYDPVTEKTDRSPGLWLAKQGVTGGIEKLHIDSQKNFWVKSYEDGFFFYNPKKKLLKKVDFGYTIDKFPKDFSVTSFCETEDGMVMTSNMGELICVDGQRGRVLWRDDTVKKALDTYNDYWVYVDKDGLRWVITHSTNTYIYNPAEKRWYTSLTELMKAKGFSNVPEDIVVWEVRYDARGLLWVATDHLGVLVLDFQTKEWKQFTYQKGDNTSLPDITAKHLYVDPLGRMWVATYKSGVAMCADAMASFTSLPYGDINAICEDKEGYYWLGLNSGGIRKMDPETLEIVAEYDKQVLGTPNAVIVGAYCAKDGTLWFGTWEGGLIRYRDGQWKTYLVGTPGSGLTTNNVWSITEDLWGNIWVGLLGGGAMRIDAKSGVQRVFNETNSNLKTNWTNSINTASNGWILLGNAEYCSVIHPKTYQIINIPVPHDETTYTISSATIQAIWDKRGLVWQAASSGLSIYDRKTGKTRLLDMKSGFFGSNVTSITEDAQQTIWVTTDHGISNVVPQKGEDGEWHFTVRSFNEHDGLQPGPFNQRAICYTSTGMILVGGQDGLDIINTKNLAVGHLDEKPVFSGLQLFDKDVAVGEEVDGRVILKEALNVCREITLNFNDQFTIQMGSNAGSIANTKRFVYMLEGFNESWVRTSDLNPNITYNSLRAGDYTLRVRMLNDDGTFGQEEATLEITIRPPLWRTRWMILLYMLIIAGVAFVWRKWFMKRLEDRMKVETMRRELEQQQWMNEMRMKMATEQANKQRSDGTAKDTVKLNLTTEDLVVFIRAICEHYESPIPDKKVKVSFLSAVDQLTADFDEAKLKEILEILFRNSINFTPYDPLISVGVARIQNDMAQIQVADNGIGIKDEYKEHAFDPMVNGEGIGLDRVKSIVDAHHGTIRIEDNPGGGTIFFITLPAQPEIEVVEAEVVND
jgi:ligand-binding sensor domain-containing protein